MVGPLCKYLVTVFKCLYKMLYSCTVVVASVATVLGTTVHLYTWSVLSLALSWLSLLSSCRVVVCHVNEDCGLTEACISGVCQPPCAVHNPCAHNAICVNTNHGTDCSCAEGFHGNGFIGCLPGEYCLSFLRCNFIISLFI